jgi:hypothetical protein
MRWEVSQWRKLKTLAHIICHLSWATISVWKCISTYCHMEDDVIESKTGSLWTEWKFAMMNPTVFDGSLLPLKVKTYSWNCGAESSSKANDSVHKHIRIVKHIAYSTAFTFISIIYVEHIHKQKQFNVPMSK